MNSNTNINTPTTSVTPEIKEQVIAIGKAMNQRMASLSAEMGFNAAWEEGNRWICAEVAKLGIHESEEDLQVTLARIAWVLTPR